jgi:hypothetical protein
LVAEGVETQDALNTLAGFGCDVFQGYYLTRPIPVAAFDIWSAGRRITPMAANRICPSVVAIPAIPATLDAIDVLPAQNVLSLADVVTDRALSFSRGLADEQNGNEGHRAFFDDGQQESCALPG